MNKFGFLSSFLTLVLFFLKFIPIGWYFGREGTTSLWLGDSLGITTNPWVSSYVHIPLELFRIENDQFFIWGLISNGNIQLWHEINIFTFFILFVPAFLAGFLTFIGCIMETKGGKMLMNFNFIALLTIFLFILCVIPNYSEILIGIKIDLNMLLLNLNYGFFLLLFDVFLALIAISQHPIMEE